jgi:hypothetical protein
MLFRRVGSDRIVLGADDPVGDIRSASSKRPWACRVMSGGRRRRAMARHCGTGRDSLKSIRTN